MDDILEGIPTSLKTKGIYAATQDFAAASTTLHTLTWIFPKWPFDLDSGKSTLRINPVNLLNSAVRKALRQNFRKFWISRLWVLSGVEYGNMADNWMEWILNFILHYSCLS